MSQNASHPAGSTGFLSRRQLLAAAGAAAIGGLASSPRRWAFAADVTATKPAPAASQRYKVAACDWMMKKRQKLGAIKLSADCGLDGVEVDMGPLGTRPTIENALRDESTRQQFLDAAKQNNVEICSLALSCFYGQSFGKRANADEIAAEWVGLMRQMGVKVGFLPLGKLADEELRKQTVAHLKTAAALAEKAGVTLGVEAQVTADEYIKLLDDVGSPAVKVYYDFGSPLEAGRDVCAELKRLGGKRLAQLHCQDRTDAGEARLGQGKVDFPRVKSILDEEGWSGWLVIDRSRILKESVQANFSANARYLKQIFQSA